MSVIARRPGRWAQISYPPALPRPRAEFRYAQGGAWTRGTRVGFKEIASLHGITEVWDLICYNFQCRNPAEINWCLNHFLGCTKSVDGKNYSFDRHDPRPILYIPPRGWRAFTPSDEQVHNAVLTTLNEPEIDMIRFTLGPLKVTRKLFSAVEDAVRARSIWAIDMASGPPAPEGVRALYSPVLDFFWIRNPASFDAAKRAVVVHEAIHAGMDIGKHGGNLLLHEAVAHVGEAMRMALSMPDPRAVDLASIPAAHMRAAMRLALRVINHNMTRTTTLAIPLIDADYLALREALRAVPIYGSRAGEDYASNGI